MNHLKNTRRRDETTISNIIDDIMNRGLLIDEFNNAQSFCTNNIDVIRKYTCKLKSK